MNKRATERVNCYHCKGKGKVPYVQGYETCPACDGQAQLSALLDRVHRVSRGYYFMRDNVITYPSGEKKLQGPRIGSKGIFLGNEYGKDFFYWHVPTKEDVPAEMSWRSSLMDLEFGPTFGLKLGAGVMVQNHSGELLHRWPLDPEEHSWIRTILHRFSR
jgi:hypothetical protein